MADAAVAMAHAGCTSIAVLGVDFMSENVRAILDEAGLQHVKVLHHYTALACSCYGTISLDGEDRFKYHCFSRLYQVS